MLVLCSILEVRPVSKVVFLSRQRPSIVIRYFCGNTLSLVQLAVRVWLWKLLLLLLHRVIILVIRWIILAPHKWRWLFLTLITHLHIILPMLQRALTSRNIAILHGRRILCILEDSSPLALHLVLILELDLLVILTHLIIILSQGIKDEGQRTIFTFFARTEAID